MSIDPNDEMQRRHEMKQTILFCITAVIIVFIVARCAMVTGIE